MRKWLKRGGVALLLLVSLAVLVAWWLMRASLPAMAGEFELAGLSAAVTVQRDDRGTVTIDADNELDAMRALGYVHAQERYFEMDLMRRTAAGELAELFGPAAIDTDKKHRVHRMRARVTEHLELIAGNKLLHLEAYTDGVNAGLAGLKARPWPYLLLRQHPQPWQLADSALTGYAMYFDLQDSTNARELALWRIEPHLPAPLFALLTRDGTNWDAPLTGAARGDAVLPVLDQLDLRKLAYPDSLAHPDPYPSSQRTLGSILTSASQPAAAAGSKTSMDSSVRWNDGKSQCLDPLCSVDTAIAGHTLPDRPEVGSNNFAVSGALTRDGRAIVANDMHLGLRAPNIWFRARLRYGDGRASGGQVDVSGFTLPGLPAVVVGSNGHVAWGFTNSYGDWLDWKRQPPCRRSSATDARCPGTTTFLETIKVAGAPDTTLSVEETRWGPVMHREADGSLLSLRWVAHLPGSLTLDVADFARATSLENVLGVADRVGLPAQNLVVGDSSGRIAWRLLGPVPQRNEDCRSGEFVVDAMAPPAAGAHGLGSGPCPEWNIQASGAPALTDPESERLWTANTRVVDGAPLAMIGDGGYTLGARGRQIRDGLFAKPQFTERDLLAIQLDDRALFLERWWKLLRDEATRAQVPATATPALIALAEASATWQGRASAESTSYRIVRAWRLGVHERIANGLTAPARVALGEDFQMPALPQLEGVVWPLVTQRPEHLLPRRFDSWNALFEDAASEVRDGLAKLGPLEGRSWGERNTAAICHPLARSIPLGKRLLCMPADPLRGDTHMPLVAAPGFGASERMVVAPGFEDDGIIHMPGGQSGHPLSPFWGAGHDDWVRGEATPFLPGPARHTMRFLPGG